MMAKYNVWVEVLLSDIIEAESVKEAEEKAEQFWDYGDCDEGNFKVVVVEKLDEEG